MSSGKEIKSDIYDEEWIESAWGKSRNEELLNSANYLPRPRVQRAFELAQLQPGDRLLDIACGRGEVPLLAARQGANAIGIDYSEAAISFSRKLLKSQSQRLQPAASLNYIKGSACELPFADDSFERVTMLDIVEHLTPDQLEQMFREVRRVLKSDGFAVIHTLPNRWVYDITFPMVHFFFRKLPRNPRGPIDSRIHINEQDLPSLHRALHHTGLKHCLWLEQHMAKQARWTQENDHYGDNRDNIYPALKGILGKLIEGASVTPLKLLLSNDIFALAWKEQRPRLCKCRFALTEYLASRFPFRRH